MCATNNVLLFHVQIYKNRPGIIHIAKGLKATSLISLNFKFEEDIMNNGVPANFFPRLCQFPFSLPLPEAHPQK